MWKCGGCNLRNQFFVVDFSIKRSFYHYCVSLYIVYLPNLCYNYVDTQPIARVVVATSFRNVQRCEYAMYLFCTNSSFVRNFATKTSAARLYRILFSGKNENPAELLFHIIFRLLIMRAKFRLTAFTSVTLVNAPSGLMT